MSKRKTSPAPRRGRPILRRIAVLLFLPLLSLTVLWGYSADTTLTAAVKKFDFSEAYDRLGVPSTGIMSTLAQERTAAVIVAGGQGVGEASYRTAIALTDSRLEDYRAAISDEDALATLSDSARQQILRVKNAFVALEPLRARVQEGRNTPVETIEGYSAIISQIGEVTAGMVSLDDVQVVQESKSLLFLFWSHDLMVQESTLISTLAGGTRLDAASRVAFASWAGARRQIFQLGYTGLTGNRLAIMRKVVESSDFARFEALEKEALTAGTTPDPEEWKTVVGRLAPFWGVELDKAGQSMKTEQVEPIGRRIMTEFVLAGVIGLVAVLSSLVLSVRFARGMSAELRSLQDAARGLAHERLPRVVARLRRGEEVDPAAEAPPIEGGATREITEVADAFGAVRRTAIDVAVAESRLRQSVGQVFVNLSWRSQALLQRQLQLLDVMERRASSPEELEDLFKLDHLTTRMRRHAEGLVILSGAPTVRAWDHPVDIEDVVRAALGEVEDYTRVDVAVSSPAAIQGEVVADVIHLLAELIENATMFSPPTTEVLVRAEAVANGVVVEIVDRGIGLYPEQLAALNRSLAEPPEFDLADSDRLGLFVVARLAAQHGIKVTLQPSAYGGTTAVVLVPGSLVVRSGDQPRAVRERQPVRASSMSPAAAPVSRPSPPSPQPASSPQYGGPGTVSSVATQPPSPAAEDSERTGRLPRRNRQQHLAHQLRAPSGPRHAAEPENSLEDDGFVEPDPEFSRDLMSALQSGWLRGRGPEDDTTEFEIHDERGRP